jgi:hypothetical protein
MQTRRYGLPTQADRQRAINSSSPIADQQN